MAPKSGWDSDKEEPQAAERTSVEQVKKNEPENVTKKEKVKRHCARFKWWYVVGTIVLLAILLPILFEVIVPAIIQAVVNGQKLPVYGGALTILSPTQLNMSLDTSLNTPLGVKIDPLTLNLYNKNTTEYTPFLKLPLPTLHIHHKTNVTVTNETIPVENEQELTTWFDAFFDQPSVKLSVKADTKVHLGALKYSPKIHKTIEIPSLNYLNGIAAEDLEFMIPADGNGHNLKGHLNLPNSGVLTLSLGNLSLNLMSGNVRLGIAHLPNVVLKPGNNSQAFEGNFFFDALIPNLSTILNDQQAALSQGKIQLNATGNATVVNGQHIKYVETILAKKRLTVEVSVISLLGDVLSGIAGDESGSLLSVFGEALGNTTLLTQMLDNWDSDTQSSSQKRDLNAPKKSSFKKRWMLNLLKLGIRSKRW